jgi:hypothetical protein
MNRKFYLNAFGVREVVLCLVAMKNAMLDPARLLFDI